MLGTFIVTTTAFFTVLLLWTAYSVVADSKVEASPRSKMTRARVKWLLVLAVIVTYLVFQVIAVLPALNLMGVI